MRRVSIGRSRLIRDRPRRSDSASVRASAHASSPDSSAASSGAASSALVAAGFARDPRRMLFEDAMLSPLGLFTTVTSIAFLIGGIVWPQAAEALLRILLATLVLGFIVARAHDAIESLREEQKTYSPFHSGGSEIRPPLAPRVVQELGFELSAADDPRLAGRTPIPWPIRRAVAREAERRLKERHALTLADPDDHTGIRGLMSAATWSVLRAYADRSERGPSRASAPAYDRGATPSPGRDQTAASARARGSATTPLSGLSAILDDVERL